MPNVNENLCGFLIVAEHVSGQVAFCAACGSVVPAQGGADARSVLPCGQPGALTRVFASGCACWLRANTLSVKGKLKLFDSVLSRLGFPFAIPFLWQPAPAVGSCALHLLVLYGFLLVRRAVCLFSGLGRCAALATEGIFYLCRRAS